MEHVSGLIFTIAQNGYDTAFLQCIASQRGYARRIGATYVCVTKPRQVSDTAISAWLKIPLVLNALRSGYEWVMYIDADCEVATRAPDFRADLSGKEGDVFMARGRSGRINSGVIIARRTDTAVRFISSVMDSITEPVPPEDRQSLKYENGNVIFVDRTQGGVSQIDLRWNNTFDPSLVDYVRHYTGAMRPLLKRILWREAQYQLLRRFRARQLTKFQSQPESRGVGFVEALRAAEFEASEAHPELRLAGATG